MIAEVRRDEYTFDHKLHVLRFVLQRLLPVVLGPVHYYLSNSRDRAKLDLQFRGEEDESFECSAGPSITREMLPSKRLPKVFEERGIERVVFLYRTFINNDIE